jgi:5'-nucleotidase / UDP-sugar diphosphatase
VPTPPIIALTVRAFGATIALINAGSLRAAIRAGNVTRQALLSSLPFWNTIAFVKLRGDDLMAALQNSVSRIGESSGTGRFLQVAGLRYTYNANRPPGLRVLSAFAQTRAGTWVAVSAADTYAIATLSFIRQGGDGYSMMADPVKAIDPYDNGIGIDQAIVDYFIRQTPYNVSLDNRIVVSNDSSSAFLGSCLYSKTITASSYTLLTPRLTSAALMLSTSVQSSASRPSSTGFSTPRRISQPGLSSAQSASTLTCRRRTAS